MMVKEIREKSLSDLQQELLGFSKELFNLRMQQGITKNSVKPHLLRNVRKNIARVKTVLREKEGSND